MRENDFLSWIGSQTPPHARVPINIGDDMAAVQLPANLALLKIDQCLDQVHFDLRHHTPAQAGRKAVNRCLSDCAAMACVPAAILISVALPREGPGSGEGAAKELFLACRDAAGIFDCPLVGGDTAIWDQRLAITVAAMGTLSEDGTEVRRSGAKVGDTLFVSGQLGGSIKGRHLSFVPRIELALKLAKAAGTGAGGGLHAMMDLSDGLAQDLPRMCAASGVGAQVYVGQLPIHPDAQEAGDGVPAGLHALADGEDYELLFALDPEATPEIVNLDSVPVTAIGVVTAERALKLIDAGGKAHAWPRAGWEHRT
ncbi:MAG TPA: thiamine-phosphate kinase [Phycisphaerae bacterium]